jgi:TonB-linked SusC/RagA family outer membrane protein
MRNAPLRTILTEIENQTDYLFFYNSQVDVTSRVTIHVKSMPVNEVLSELFSNSQVNYAMEGTSIMLTDSKISSENRLETLVQQSITITGKVTDAEGEPLPGVSVKIKGTTHGTATDANGAYSLPVPDGNATLVFSYVGFITQENNVGNQRIINVTLRDDTRQIEEVVVVGYGQQRVSTITGSVSQIKSDKITLAPIANVTNVLAGQLPGLVTKQTSGVPGLDGAYLRIRGSGRSPLVIVDGMENSFENLDVNQIETVSVLKDGAASIYGARAGDGVILITTKRGLQSKPKINVNSSLTLQGSTRVLKPASSAERAQSSRDSYLNTGNDPALAPFTEAEIQKFKDGSDPVNYPNTDWYGACVRRYAPQQNHNLTITGGNEAIKYYGYFGYNTQETILKTNGGHYDRYNFQINIDTKVTKQISFAMDIKHFKEIRYYPDGADGFTTPQNFWSMIYLSSPRFPLTLPDPSKQSYAGVSYGNPVWATNSELCGFQDRRQNNTVFSGELKYDFKFIPGLNVKGRISYLNDDSNFKLTREREAFYTYNASADLYTLERESQDPRDLAISSSHRNRLVQQYSLNYNNLFLDVHTFSGMLMYEWQEDKYNEFTTRRSGFITLALPEFFAGDPTTTTADSYSFGMGRVSWLGRLNYSYMDRYMVETILRADASSRFAKDYRWGYFPSVSFGWNIAKEDFMSNLNSLDQLKLRLSYGSSGYDGVANFAYMAGYSYSGNYTFDGNLVSGLIPTSLANFTLSWEKMSIYNAGLDFSWWNRQLYGEFDYFYRKRDGIPATRRGSLPDTFGAGLPQENLNSQGTAGFEFRLGTSGKAGDVHYDIAGNISYAVSKWIDYDEADYTDEDEIRLYKNSGKVTDRRYGYVFDGLFTSQQEIDQWPLTFEDLGNSNTVLRPGDVKYKDLNGDGVIDWRDQKEIGKGSTPHAFFGLNINLGYKNFDLAALFQGAFDYNTTVSVNGNTSSYCNNYWHETRNNKADALYPRPSGSAITNGYNSDYRNLRTSYMRLKNLSVGYQIPVSLLSKIGVEKCRFYVAGTNIFTISTLDKYKLDPEATEGYTAGYWYPQQFTMSIGCSLTF